MRDFGIEFELCYAVIQEDTWINCIKYYIKDIINTVNNKDDIKQWCKTFDNTLLIQDDDNNIYKLNVLTNELQPINNSDIISSYMYPLITYDSTVICHNTLRKRSKNNYDLGNYNYSINVEVVSQILHNVNELKLFDALFIKYNNIITNKSQGIHLTIDVTNLTKSNILDIITHKYVPWERIHQKRVRPINSCWAQILTDKNINNCYTRNLRNTFHKQKSIRMKNTGNNKLLEFRLQSSTNTNYINDCMYLYNMFNKYNGGKYNNRKTRKLRSK